ncbi:probable serine/threonine-protein kinase SIS8 isoform X2 [Prosopis cineraria]|uniref:probable serine/threonine-protein kinase SIS8 isoform X2 n=1 Tax=Prosopis cineraria TaxID=364024 RepID=UPI00240F392C|nr:probable serine/threonine-protein kinase SIS8 isoform X2 [Prosopis cineraria]
MKNILKKLHIMSNRSEDAAGSTSSRGHKSNDGSFPKKPSNSRSPQNSEHKPFPGLSSWLHSVANRQSLGPPSLNLKKGERVEPSDLVSSGGLDIVSGSARRDSGSSTSRDPEVEEEYQIQLALEMSAKEDPEAVQIEAVKQISLGSCCPDNTPAEVVAYRYWNYNAIGYDDKILDGFYDLYGILNEAQSTSATMPSLVDLQGTPTSDSVAWEAVLVNRAADSNLLKLEQKALELAVKSRPNSEVVINSDSVQRLAILVADYMGGPVTDPESMTRAWKSLSYSLKATLGSMVLPLGSLTIGLARHRALLFKVLCDSMGIPCCLVKGLHYTGSDDVAMNFVKVDDGREYIVDLMADPGTLIPSDATGSHNEYDESVFVASPLSRDLDSSHVASSSSGIGSSSEEASDFGTFDKRNRSKQIAYLGKESYISRPTTSEDESKGPLLMQEAPGRPNYPYVHVRSPSWTEGISSPAVRRRKVKDVSQYMIDAAMVNPQLAQKLHDVLLESGVVAPPNLFSETYHQQLGAPIVENNSNTGENEFEGESGKQEAQPDSHQSPAQFLPPLPPYRAHLKAIPSSQLEQSKPLEGLGINLPFDHREVAGQHLLSHAEATLTRYGKNVPVAAAAAAVVASSMVVAVAKSSNDSNIELPVAAAATATAAAVVATTAAVGKQCDQGSRSDGDSDGAFHEQGVSDHGEHSVLGENTEGERISDRSISNDSTKSDSALDDVAEYEIPWEDITLGERIGLGSYGEVYRGEWHGTEVAVKRFLDQDISGESLEEFISEVRIMKRLRHPNVVLFMGAVTKPPNLSIVTEFLARGSLYRLIHRPNNQLDERRRLRMALDAARGMNYLHNCSPVIVHRDLKSPNLLVDKNWVVKVCDFGLSRMKHSTFLSSRSTAGTAEWMAPEILRNEPSNEKCDVFSFGVILWELSTMQQPWGGMNPMQVVGAVGFQHRRLEIPDDMDPDIADIIRKCWQTDPKLRPSFAEIMAALKPLQKPIISSQVQRSSASRVAQDPAG